MKVKINFSGIDRVVNPSFMELLNFYDKRMILTYGGAGSGKSVASAQIAMLALLQGRNQLIVRKVARTHRHSTFAEALAALDQLKIGKLMQVTRSTLLIRCVNGAEAHFVGCDNVEKLKSIRPTKGMFDDIHIEEATELTLQDLYVIDTRQRGISDKPRRMFLRFNPIYASHWIKKEFFDSDKWDALLHKTTYKDNLFLSEQDKQKYESYKNIDEYMYNVYALGEWGLLGGVIFDKLDIVNDKPQELAGIKPLYGLDFGYEHPSACIRVFCNDNTIYIDDEIYERKLTNDELAKEVLPFSAGELVVCDTAEPKSIKELQRHGVKAIPAKKGQGSILTGIKFIKERRLVINERCVNVIAELEQYRRKVASDGTYLEEPVDANNHAIDAIRYALEQVYMGTRISTVNIF